MARVLFSRRSTSASKFVAPSSSSFFSRGFTSTSTDTNTTITTTLPQPVMPTTIKSLCQNFLDTSIADNTNTSTDDAAEATTESHPTPLTVRGWVRSARHQKNFVFLEVVDGSTMEPLQVILPTKQFEPSSLKDLTTGCSVSVEGQFSLHPKHKDKVELHAQDFSVIGPCDSVDYPLQKKYHSLDFLRQPEVIHLRPRSNTISAATRVSLGFVIERFCVRVHVCHVIPFLWLLI